MAFTVTIDQFEGPLDLMLHLIKDNKLELFELDMDVLTDQYLQYLNAMESMHLEIASEYLAELAGLIEYKSRKLLPREKVVIEEEYEERQLLMSKPMSEETQKWLNTTVEGEFVGNPYDLIKAMNRVLRRAALTHPYETRMTVKELSLDERVIQIKNRLKNWVGKMSFEELCSDCVDLHMIIVTFLSVLDLIKHKEITFHIDEEETIWIIRGEQIYA